MIPISCSHDTLIMLSLYRYHVVLVPLVHVDLMALSCYHDTVLPCYHVIMITFLLIFFWSLKTFTHTLKVGSLHSYCRKLYPVVKELCLQNIQFFVLINTILV
jgi:hypothetical protein